MRPLAKKRHILVEGVSVAYGGGATYNRCLVNAMAELAPNWEFHVVTGSHYLADNLDNRPNLHCHFITDLDSSLSRFAWRQLRLPSKLAALRCDAALTQFPGIFLLGIPQVMLSLNSHCLIDPPVANTALGRFKRRFQRFLFTVGYRWVDKTIYLSKQMVGLSRRWVGPNPRKAAVVYEGVDPLLLARAARLSKQEQKKKQNYFLAVSTVSYHKNYPMLLKSFAEFTRDRGCDFRLKVAGRFTALDDYRADGGSKPQLIQLSEQLGIADLIDWLGYVEGEPLYDLFTSATAFISTSLLEAFPLTAIEAMGSGTAAVVPDSTSFPEIVRNAGYYHDPHRSETLASQLRLVTSDPALYRQRVTEGLRLAQEYSWQRAADECLSILASLLPHP